MSSAFPVRLLLPRPENNWLCPGVHLWNYMSFAKPIIAPRDSGFFLSFSDSLPLTLPNPTPAPRPADFCFPSPIPGPVRLYFLLHRDKKPSGAQVSTVSGLPFPGCPARPRPPAIKRHPPPALSLYFSPPASAPPQLLCLCPSAPLPLSLGYGYLVLAEQCRCQLVLSTWGGAGEVPQFQEAEHL